MDPVQGWERDPGVLPPRLSFQPTHNECPRAALLVPPKPGPTQPHPPPPGCRGACRHGGGRTTMRLTGAHVGNQCLSHSPIRDPRGTSP